MSGRGLPEYLNAYLREQMRAWIAAEPGRKQTHLARELEFTDAQVSAVLGEKRGAGWDMLGAVAKKLLGITRDELEARALAAWKERKPDTRVEYDERYPNKRKALAGLAAAGVALHARTVRGIDTRIYHSTVDPPPEHWLKEILALEEKVRWEEAHPAEAAAEREREKARLEQLLAEENAKSQAAVDKIAGLRGPRDLDPPPPKAGKKPGGK
jgi:hypothetical protein